MAIGGTPVGNMIIKVDLDSVGLEKSMTGLQRQLKSSNTAMGAQLSAFDRGGKSTTKYGVLIDGLSSRHKIQARMVQEASTKYSAMSDEYGENSVKAQQAAQSLNEQIARYQETGRELDNMTAEFKEFQRIQELQNTGWYKTADSMEKWGGKLQVAGKKMSAFGKSYTMKVTAPIVAGGVAVFKAASDYESAFAGVRKTVDATEAEFDALSRGIRDMAKELPTAATDIAEIAEAAGQLGIKKENILGFTCTIIDLSEATNLTAEQASTEFARFANIVGMSQGDFDRLGSSVVALGNTMATTESEIVAMSMRLAAQGKQVGMSEAQIMALAGTMSSLGISAEAGGTAMTTVLKKIDKAVGEGGKSLDGFAKAAKIDSKKFADAWKKDPINALDMFVKGLGESGDEGENLTSILEDLGIKGIRETDTLLRMAGASDILSEAVDTSSTAWDENSALSEEAALRYETTESKLKILWNRIKDVAITLGDALIPAVMGALDAAEPLIKKIEEGAQAFADMDTEQQQSILKMIGFAAVVGPAAMGLGGLTTAAGGFLKISGSLTKAIGMSKGVGLAGSLASLGPLAVGGIAVAGLTAVGLGVYKLVKESKELEEVNLDVANSLTDQAIELENSANTFDKLSSKAKLSNEQLAELNDLNIRISKSSNPGEINELQKQYDALAKKSGLSKDELILLFEANGNIIDQTPEVKTSVSEQGNAFAENTDAVKEYIATLHEMTLVELQGQRVVALENEVKLKKEITKQEKEAGSLREEIGNYNKEALMSDTERKARIEEINGLYRDQTVSDAEKTVLMEEQVRLINLESGIHGDIIVDLQKEIDEKNISIGKSKEELSLIEALDMEMANIVLKQVGINEEGDKGLAKLDEVIAKNSEELTKLDEKLEKNGKLSEEEQKRYEKLTATNEKHAEAKTYLNEELGLYKDLNSLAEGKLNKADAETKKKIESLAKTSEIKVEEGNIVGQIQKKNTEYDKAIAKLGQQKKEEGANKKEIDKQITALQDKKTKNDEVIKKILIELGVWDQVKDSIETGTQKEKEKGKATDDTKNKVDSQGKSIDGNNKKTDAGIGKEKERSKEAGKDVDKKVDVDDYGTVAKLNMNAAERKEKFVTLNPGTSLATLNRQASSPVSKTINFIGKGLSKLKFWAKGTPPQGHPGGMAVVGDGGGRELIKTPGGATFLSPSTDTMMDLPKGTHVIPHRKTERLLKSAPRYAKGTNDWQGLFDYENIKDNEFMKLLALNNKHRTNPPKAPKPNNTSNSDGFMKDLLKATLEQNEILMQLLQKDTNTYLDSRILGERAEPHITEIQDRNKKRRDSFA